MRISKTLAMAAFVVLAGCSSQLSPQDRAMLNETRNVAMQARDQAARAAQDAAQARQSAEQAAAAAQAASTRSDRIFRSSQAK